ncbi:MAG TPA: cytochrome c oxidase subunit 3 [Pseudogracilibacillus sp.]|nr:cytochrome c oxidase subunit 3 [Pseudogracilibacillus sp.]
MNTYEQELFRDKQLGFFIYLGVEAVMFLTLFTTYLIYTPSSEGPAPADIFSITTLVLSSVFLLSSSGTIMISEKGLETKNHKKIITWLFVTFVFALVFLGFEITEFVGFVNDGYGVSASSFLSSYFALVGLHAAHVLFGCGWMLVLFIQLSGIKIPFPLFIEKFKIFTYYWHFVDIVWVFIILLVYVKYLV